MEEAKKNSTSSDTEHSSGTSEKESGNADTSDESKATSQVPQHQQDEQPAADTDRSLRVSPPPASLTGNDNSSNSSQVTMLFQ